MKKLKLRGQEIKRTGITNDRAIAVALHCVSRHFRRANKTEVLEKLEKVNLHPEKYVNDEIFGELATIIINPPKEKRKEGVVLKSESEYYKIFGEHLIDREAIEQMDTAMKLPIAVKGALMPDAHVGYGLPIGGVLAAYNAVIPYGVGMDIGCRMCMSIYPLSPQIINTQKNRLSKILFEETRFGLSIFDNIIEHELLERHIFNEIKFVNSLKDKFARQLGTSGHGNHFVDIGIVEIKRKDEKLKLPPGTYFAILSHSGSRNFGAEVCRHYTNIARDKLQLSGEAVRLAWLDLASQEGQEYWQAMELAGDYSAANHHIIHNRLSSALGEKPIVRIENHHNYAWKERISEGEELIIHRKGATPANYGDIGIIPGTMATPAFLVKGKGNELSLNSAAHGAGRRLSRRKAKSELNVRDLHQHLKTKGVELLSGGIDESPMAYKDVYEVMEQQKSLVDVIGLFYPKIVRME
jgi:tRNA-splicing ligase RtcB